MAHKLLSFLKDLWKCALGHKEPAFPPVCWPLYNSLRCLAVTQPKLHNAKHKKKSQSWAICRLFVIGLRAQIGLHAETLNPAGY